MSYLICIGIRVHIPCRTQMWVLIFNAGMFSGLTWGYEG